MLNYNLALGYPTWGFPRLDRFSRCITTSSHRFVYGAEICLRIITVITSVTRPIHICIVRIKPERRRLQCQTIQVIVWSTGFVVDTFHVLENATRENRSLVESTNSIHSNFKQSLCNKSAFGFSASAVIDGSKWQLVTAARLECVPCIFT